MVSSRQEIQHAKTGVVVHSCEPSYKEAKGGGGHESLANLGYSS